MECGKAKGNFALRWWNVCLVIWAKVLAVSENGMTRGMMGSSWGLGILFRPVMGSCVLSWRVQKRSLPSRRLFSMALSPEGCGGKVSRKVISIDSRLQIGSKGSKCWATVVSLRVLMSDRC